MSQAACLGWGVGVVVATNVGGGAKPGGRIAAIGAAAPA